jgi:hypothetical protein
MPSQAASLLLGSLGSLKIKAIWLTQFWVSVETNIVVKLDISSGIAYLSDG